MSEQTSKALSPNTKSPQVSPSGPRGSQLKTIPAGGASRGGPLGASPTLGGTRGTPESRGAGSPSPYLFDIRFRNVDVCIHLLKVLLGPVSLFAIPLKPSFALQAEGSGVGGPWGPHEQRPGSLPRPRRQEHSLTDCRVPGGYFNFFSLFKNFFL